MLKKRGIKYGIMFTGDGVPVATDEGWIAIAQQRVRDYETVIKDKPDQVIFTSWNPHPSRDLPETTPNTLAYLIDWYFNQGR
jgi:hypothetical protein